MVLWLTGASGLCDEVAEELWALLPGARVVDPGPVEHLTGDGVAALEAAPAWRALTATAAAELTAWRSERLVVPRPLGGTRTWWTVEAALLRAGLEGVLVALVPLPGTGGTDEGGGPDLVGATADPAWPLLRADVVLDPAGRTAAQLAADVTAVLGTGVPTR